MDFKVDFVVSWVNSNDIQWQNKKNELLQRNNQPTLMVGEERYHDYGFFRYWFRAIEKYAPWVNHVYVVTDQQIPDFFSENDKFTIIDHKEFIPHEFLPTFSSSVIELYLDKIPNLSDNFVYFNDDTFLNAPVKVSDFFNNKGIPLDMAVPTLLAPHSEFDHLPFNNSLVLNRYFNKREILRKNWRYFFKLKYGFSNLLKLLMTLPFPYWSSFTIQHIPFSLKKSDYLLLKKYAGEEMVRTSQMHFRSDKDINLWLLEEIRFMLGKFSPRSAKDGHFFDFDSASDLVKCISKGETKLICINDDSKKFGLHEKERVALKISDAFEKKFPNKASIEQR